LRVPGLHLHACCVTKRSVCGCWPSTAWRHGSRFAAFLAAVTGHCLNLCRCSTRRKQRLPPACCAARAAPFLLLPARHRTDAAQHARICARLNAHLVNAQHARRVATSFHSTATGLTLAAVAAEWTYAHTIANAVALLPHARRRQRAGVLAAFHRFAGVNAALARSDRTSDY